MYRAENERYYFFETIPEEVDTYDPTRRKVQEMQGLLTTYMKTETNKSLHSKTYEPVTKTHPHYPGRMDQAMFHEKELAAIPKEYTIDLG